jgi:photosystem II stability/assembly factor-like uncharacterized protein
VKTIGKERAWKLSALLIAFGAALLFIPHNPYPAERATGDELRESENGTPGIERYLFARRYNSRIPISAGLHAALARKADQLRALSMQKATLSTAWKCIGPDNIAGRVLCVKYHPTNPNLVFCGSASGGLWKSINGGATWTPSSDALPTLAVSCIVFDKADPQIMYIGTGEGSVNADRVCGDGVYKSTDGGASWTNITKGLIPDYDLCVNWIEQHPDAPDILFIATTYSDTSGAIFRSTDRGRVWEKVLSGPARKVSVDPFHPNRVLAAAGYAAGTVFAGGMYLSQSDGAPGSFTRVTSNLPRGDSIGNVSFEFSPAKDGAVIAIMSTGLWLLDYSAPTKDLLGVFRSADGGVHWEKIALNNDDPMLTIFRGQGWYDLYIRCHPKQPGLVFAGGVDNWVSTDFGTSWQQFSDWMNGTLGTWGDQHGLDFSPADPDILLICSDGGVFRTIGAWSKLNGFDELGAGLVTMQFYAMDYYRNNPLYIIGGTQDRGTDGTCIGVMPWQSLSGGDGGCVVFDHTDSNVVFIEMPCGYIMKSMDGGSGYAAACNGLNYLQYYGYQSAFVTPFVMHPSKHDVLFVGANMIYRTDDGATNWHPISVDLTGAYGMQYQFQAIATCQSNPDYLYAVTGAHPRVFRSRNAMANGIAKWDSVSSGLPGLFLCSVAVHPNDGETAYVGTSAFDPRSGVYKTTNGGAAWIFMPGATPATSLPNIPVNVLTIWEKNPEVVFAGTDIGVYVTTDGGANWRPYGTGMPNVVINDIKITPNGILYAASHGRGMWMSDVVLSNEGIPPVLPERPLLGVNYPNPFSSSTVIPFSLPRAGRISLHLFDAQGRIVRTLLDGELPAGDHACKLTGDGLRSGVYFCTIRCGTRSETRKLAFMR